MSLNKKKIRILKELAEKPQRSRQLAEEIGLSRSHTMSLLRDLREDGLVDKKGWMYSVSDTPEAMVLRHLFRKHLSTKFELILDDLGISILEALIQGKKIVREIAKYSGKTSRAVYYKLSLFESMALVHHTRGGYWLSERHPLYRDILSFLDAQRLSERFRNPKLEYRDAVVLWSRNSEYLVETKNPREYIKFLQDRGLRWLYSSTSAVDLYGVHVIPPKTTLYICENETEALKHSQGEYVSMEDLIIHLLLHDPFNEDHRQYIHWIITKHEEKLDFNLLIKKAKDYGLRKEIEGILYDLKPIVRSLSMFI